MRVIYYFFKTLLFVLFAALAACANRQTITTLPTNKVPEQWYEPLPQSQTGLSDLTEWWQQFNDPVLTDLISSAQNLSPSVASAATLIEQSRATRISTRAAFMPHLDANVSATRARQDSASPVATTRSTALQVSWEIDLFGDGLIALDGAQARLESAQANWNGAKVAVAAEVATDYLSYRACEAQAIQAELDAKSRAESARLTDLSAKAGFKSPADAALAQASAAQSNSKLTAQNAQCDMDVKALVGMTGFNELELRVRLADQAAQIPEPAQIQVDAVPGQVLSQRPDVFAAGLNVVAASADVLTTQAARLPSLSLAGSIGAMSINTKGKDVSGTTWSVGPLAVSLPIFDAGERRANIEAARASYDEAVVVYRSKLLGAVREVEEALIQLKSTAARSEDARIATEGFDTAFQAAQARYDNGTISLFELEDARRSAVDARKALIDLQRERVSAWIFLYRALGGGWSKPAVQNN